MIFIRAGIVAAAAILAIDASVAGEIKPYQAKEVKQYQSREIKQYQAQEVKPFKAREIQTHQSAAVSRQTGTQINQQQGAGQIQMYQAHEAKRYTKEDFARMDAQIADEAKRIAAQRKGNADPASSANAQYWQQQMMHRQVEAANPDVTYNGR